MYLGENCFSVTVAAVELEGKRINKKWYPRNLERMDKAMQHSGEMIQNRSTVSSFGAAGKSSWKKLVNS